MDSSMVGIIVAVVLAFVVFKFVKGVIKFAVLAAIVLGVVYFLSQGSF